MKSLIISLSLAVVVVVFSVGYTFKIDTVANELRELNNEIAISLKDENYESALEKADKLSGCIEDKKTLMEAIGNHEEIKSIEMNIAEMKEYIRGSARSDALSKCALLDFLFGYLPEGYHLKAENIL